MNIIADGLLLQPGNLEQLLVKARNKKRQLTYHLNEELIEFLDVKVNQMVSDGAVHLIGYGPQQPPNLDFLMPLFVIS